MRTLTLLLILLTSLVVETKETPMKITIGSQVFEATLFDNETTAALKELLPMTVKMTELNGNEKYYHLSANLPTNASKPGTIHAGDILLYGSNSLVIFYETFSSSYSYTRVGRIKDTTKLKEALGTGSVSVRFEGGN